MDKETIDQMSRWDNLFNGKGNKEKIKENRLTDLEYYLLASKELMIQFGWSEEELAKKKIPYILDCIYLLGLKNKVN